MRGAVQGGRLRVGPIRLRALRRGLGTAVHRRRSDLGVPRRVLDEGGSGRDPRDRRWPLSGAREAIRRAGAPRESSSRRYRLRRGYQRARHRRKRWGEDVSGLSRCGRVRDARGEARHARFQGRLMSKSAKRVFKIVGIAALGLATFGVGSLLAGGAAIGSALGGGIAVGSLSVSFSTLVTVGLAALSIGTLPDVPSLEKTGANNRGQAILNPDALGVFAFGNTTVPLNLVYERAVGENDEQVENVFAHAWHRIESYEALYIEGEEVT